MRYGYEDKNEYEYGVLPLTLSFLINKKTLTNEVSCCANIMYLLMIYVHTISNNVFVAIYKNALFLKSNYALIQMLLLCMNKGFNKQTYQPLNC